MLSHEAQELVLFIENDGDLYRQQNQPILRNLANKAAQGKYEHTKALKLWMYLMDNGAKKYAKKFGGGEWYKMFSVAARREAAKVFADDFEANWKAGEYRQYLTKVSTKQLPNTLRYETSKNRSGTTKPRPYGTDRDRFHGNPNARRNRAGAKRVCEHPGGHHSKKIIAIARGHATPTYLCEYHASQLPSQWK